LEQAQAELSCRAGKLNAACRQGKAVGVGFSSQAPFRKRIAAEKGLKKLPEGLYRKGLIWRHGNQQRRGVNKSQRKKAKMRGGKGKISFIMHPNRLRSAQGIGGPTTSGLKEKTGKTDQKGKAKQCSQSGEWGG